jgi:N-acetylglutamate synthase-like GNAT family acetyltransferase
MGDKDTGKPSEQGPHETSEQKQNSSGAPLADVEELQPSAAEEAAVLVVLTRAQDASLVSTVSDLLLNCSKEANTVVIPRSDQFLEEVIKTGHGVLARVLATDEIVGFGYLETWSDADVVTHGGVVVHPQWRYRGLAKRIKQLLLEASRSLYPTKAIVSITVHPAIMKINSQLGYIPERFEQLTTEERFWNRCSTCTYYDTLERFRRRQCFCLGMALRPAAEC